MRRVCMGSLVGNARSARLSCTGMGFMALVRGWQYLDIVSAQAGKLESLEYVRRGLGIAVERTVACGRAFTSYFICLIIDLSAF
jgi:hydroxymethylpyrimidine pyrophosphatase-like HAD family hydrolase